MDPLMIAAASGMKARMESLDMLANNMANSGTSGFKTDREYYATAQGQNRFALPLVERNWTDFKQGDLVPTGNPLDLALDGAGFFTLNSPAGVVFTRNGTLQVNRDNQLATADGYTLRNQRRNGQPIVVNPLRPIDIDPAGVVRQGGQELGQIEIGGFQRPEETLAKLGVSYFAIKDPANAPGRAPDAVVRQGTLEQSNVPAADSSVRLISVMRQFEMLQRAMNIGAEMNRSAGEVSRTS